MQSHPTGYLQGSHLCTSHCSSGHFPSLSRGCFISERWLKRGVKDTVGAQMEKSSLARGGVPHYHLTLSAPLLSIYTAVISSLSRRFHNLFHLAGLLDERSNISSSVNSINNASCGEEDLEMKQQAAARVCSAIQYSYNFNI